MSALVDKRRKVGKLASGQDMYVNYSAKQNEISAVCCNTVLLKISMLKNHFFKTLNLSWADTFKTKKKELLKGKKDKYEANF